MGDVTLTINDIRAVVPEGTTILDAARSADIYIPTLCAHPDLPTSKGLQPKESVYRGDDKITTDNQEEYEGCRLCIVEVEGMDAFQTSCNTLVADGMVVLTETPEIQKQRRQNLFPYLEHHPHACLACAQKEGCSRTQCSTNVPEEERCCPKLGKCELERIVDYVGGLAEVRTPGPACFGSRTVVHQRLQPVHRLHSLCPGLPGTAGGRGYRLRAHRWGNRGWHSKWTQSGRVRL